MRFLSVLCRQRRAHDSSIHVRLPPSSFSDTDVVNRFFTEPPGHRGAALGAEKVSGRIVFFNRPFTQNVIPPGEGYGRANDQRNRGPAAAAQLGAVGALTRSLTQSTDDVPHTGDTTHPPATAKIPAAALSTLAADRLSASYRDRQYR